jgi:hypothetical protein
VLVEAGALRDPLQRRVVAGFGADVEERQTALAQPHQLIGRFLEAG